MSSDEPASMKIVRSVAARRGVDPTDITPPLHDTVDTDALDRLAVDGVQVSFSYQGFLITVTGDGVSLEETYPT